MRSAVRDAIETVVLPIGNIGVENGRVDLGATIARERAAQRLSMRSLAARAGLATSTVKRIEDGTRDATLDVAERLLGALGLALDIRSADSAPLPLGELAAALISAADDPLAGLRLLGGAHRQVMRLDPPARRAWLAGVADTAPLPREWQAALAALVDWIAADTAGAIRPAWTTGARLLLRWWPIPPGIHAEQVWARTPDAFRARNVAVAAEVLAGV